MIIPIENAGSTSSAVPRRASDPPAIDPMIGAQMFSATLNASAEYRWWVPGATGDQAEELYSKPLLMGLFTK